MLHYIKSYGNIISPKSHLHILQWCSRSHSPCNNGTSKSNGPQLFFFFPMLLLSLPCRSLQPISGHRHFTHWDGFYKGLCPYRSTGLAGAGNHTGREWERAGCHCLPPEVSRRRGGRGCWMCPWTNAIRSTAFVLKGNGFCQKRSCWFRFRNWRKSFKISIRNI